MEQRNNMPINPPKKPAILNVRRIVFAVLALVVFGTIVFATSHGGDDNTDHIHYCAQCITNRHILDLPLASGTSRGSYTAMGSSFLAIGTVTLAMLLAKKRINRLSKDV